MVCMKVLRCCFFLNVNCFFYNVNISTFQLVLAVSIIKVVSECSDKFVALLEKNNNYCYLLINLIKQNRNDRNSLWQVK